MGKGSQERLNSVLVGNARREVAMGRFWGRLKHLWNIFFGRRRHCRNCQHFDEDYITAFSGQGLFRFGYCQLLFYACRVVEPDVNRKCGDFEKKEVVQEGTFEG